MRLRCLLGRHDLGRQRELWRGGLCYLAAPCLECGLSVESRLHYTIASERHEIVTRAASTLSWMGDRAAIALNSTYIPPGRITATLDAVEQASAQQGGLR